MKHRFFCLVLHSHIPYVISHGVWPHGTDWLFEASAESYLPLLDVLYRLSHEGISPKVNISFTPVLMEQLRSQAFISGFKKYLKMKIEAARKDASFFEKSGQSEFINLAYFWQSWYEKIYQDFISRWHEDILGGFKRLQDEGLIDILTSAATHAYLPLLSDDQSLRLQLRQGKFIYQQHFGRLPQGFWLPECAYRPRYHWKQPFKKSSTFLRPGIDELLQEQEFIYFFIDTHLLQGGEVKGVYLERFPALKRLWEKTKKKYLAKEGKDLSPYLPYLAEPSGVAFFGRDDKSGHQVWSSQSGYPGDGWYLEFHKKHFPGGHRYWRVTSNSLDLREKKIYQPEKVKDRLKENAEHFVNLLREILRKQGDGVIASFYDTELFGHWWFEGPEWLYHVIKKLSLTEIRTEKASVCLEILKPEIFVSLPEGSWGTGGFHWIWLNNDTAWIWEKIYCLEDEMKKLASDLAWRKTRLYRQWLREKFLLESSDWPFLISTWTARDYAENRAAEHYSRAKKLLQWLKRDEPLSQEEQKQLVRWEKEDGLFPKIAIAEKQFI